MLTRRDMLTKAGALGILSAAAGLSPVRGHAQSSSEAVNFEIPRGACDCHVHVVGDPKKFPMSPQRDYTPPPATAEELMQALKEIHFDRVVIVTPTVYGSDNSATLAAIKTIGRESARGVALIEPPMPIHTAKSMTQSGIAGVRLFLGPRDVSNPSIGSKKLDRFFDLARRTGWHLDISAPPDATGALLGKLESSPVPLVFDYFGWVAGGLEQPGFQAVLSLVSSGRAYVKLSEPYRLSKDPPDYSDLVPVVHAFVSKNPDRVLWGSGWPHVDSSAGRGKIARNLPIDDKHLLNLFGRWVPDAGIRHKILVENPARLYGF